MRGTHHRTECVSGLANVELLVIPLPLSCSHIVNDGVSPDMIPGVFLPDLKPGSAHNDANLALIVRRRGEALIVAVNVLAVRDNGSRPLGKDDGVAGAVDLVR